MNTSKFLVEKEDSSVLEHNFGCLLIIDEVGGDEATIPLKTLNIFDLSLKCFTFSDSDSTVRSKLIEDSTNQCTNVVVVVG